MQLTIFTPTFNRGYTLPKLYKSLINQTCKKFVWLIIDDGSTDDTFSLIKEWIGEGKIKIEYYKQKNQGKSIAHNNGVEFTKTGLFTCVDSDDFLKDSAVEEILKKWNNKRSVNIIGILAFKGYPNQQSLTSIKNKTINSTTLKKGYEKLGLQGDTMLVYKTEIISKYKFPDYNNENFVPEAYLYDLLDQEGELFLLRNILYYCEYLEDGYTKNMTSLLIRNSQGYLAFIKQRLKLNTRILDNVLDTVRYTAMCLVSEEKGYIKKSVYPSLTILTWPLAYFFFLKKYKAVK